MRAMLAVAGARQQADLLVVADRPRGRPDRAGDLADPHDRTGSAAVASRGWAACAGRISETTAPTSETAASTQSAVCMFWMNGASCLSERPLAKPEKILNNTSFGI